MFKNVGRKIQTMAKVYVWIGIAASFLFPLFLIKEINFATVLFCLGAAVIGSFLFWLSSLGIFGFGVILENHEAQKEERIRNLPGLYEKQPESSIYREATDAAASPVLPERAVSPSVQTAANEPPVQSERPEEPGISGSAKNDDTENEIRNTGSEKDEAPEEIAEITEEHDTAEAAASPVLPEKAVSPSVQTAADEPAVQSERPEEPGISGNAKNDDVENEIRYTRREKDAAPVWMAEITKEHNIARKDIEKQLEASLEITKQLIQEELQGGITKGRRGEIARIRDEEEKRQDELKKKLAEEESRYQEEIRKRQEETRHATITVLNEGCN